MFKESNEQGYGISVSNTWIPHFKFEGNWPWYAKIWARVLIIPELWIMKFTNLF